MFVCFLFVFLSFLIFANFANFLKSGTLIASSCVCCFSIFNKFFIRYIYKKYHNDRRVFFVTRLSFYFLFCFGLFKLKGPCMHHNQIYLLFSFFFLSFFVNGGGGGGGLTLKSKSVTIQILVVHFFFFFCLCFL